MNILTNFFNLFKMNKHNMFFVKCETCYKFYDKSSFYESNLHKHLPAQLKICEVCSLTYDITDHAEVQKHSFETICTICKMVYNTRSGPDIKKHLNEVKCDTCNQVYDKSDNELAQKHKGEKQCKVCFKLFDSRDPIVHLKHINEFKCPTCGDIYDIRDKSTRDKHQTSNHLSSNPPSYELFDNNNNINNTADDNKTTKDNKTTNDNKTANDNKINDNKTANDNKINDKINDNKINDNKINDNKTANDNKTDDRKETNLISNTIKKDSQMQFDTTIINDICVPIILEHDANFYNVLWTRIGDHSFKMKDYLIQKNLANINTNNQNASWRGRARRNSVTYIHNGEIIHLPNTTSTSVNQPSINVDNNNANNTNNTNNTNTNNTNNVTNANNNINNATNSSTPPIGPPLPPRSAPPPLPPPNRPSEKKDFIDLTRVNFDSDEDRDDKKLKTFTFEVKKVQHGNANNISTKYKVFANMPILDFKNHLAKIYQQFASSIKLVFSGKILDDNYTFEKYPELRDNLLHIAIRVPNNENKNDDDNDDIDNR